ncbi:hypothetical protein [Prosthecobacter dejongeii]|uniref:Uncharacterized protein n=1 Tax=Prosthecobacter dejongeii TaxID=48465 RepID=A0A7W7YKG5_9BACT|nr:hypothetical protein [Prosthecobacter dejongeii]MBB5037575.1 hypothetical protein [Prosthecobacter dejongeii]
MNPFFYRSGLVLVSLALLSCGSAAYRSSIRNYSDAYARGSDDQMLLNLVRLRQHQPAHWVQPGPITTSMNFERGLNAGSARGERSLGLAGSLGLNLKADERPSFTYIPLTGKEFTDRMMAPIPPKVFITLFEEGWPIDRLMRLMVERIELGSGKGGLTILPNDPGSGRSTYLTFLKTCEVARILQREGALDLEVQRRFSPLAAGHSSPLQPSTNDLINAREKGLIWQQQGTGWVLGEMQQQAVFRVREGAAKTVALSSLRSQPEFQSADGEEAISTFLQIVEKGLSLRADGGTDGGSGARAELVVRSFGGIMSAVAQEEPAYEGMSDAQQAVLKSAVPAAQQEPILRLSWAGVPAADLQKPTVKIHLDGESWMITDYKQGEQRSRNRDTFRFLVGLSHLVASDLDSLKFPQTLLIQ